MDKQPSYPSACPMSSASDNAEQTSFFSFFSPFKRKDADDSCSNAATATGENASLHLQQKQSQQSSAQKQHEPLTQPSYPSACPMSSTSSSTASDSAEEQTGFFSFFSSAKRKNANDSYSNAAAATGEKAPASLEEAAAYPQTPQADQRISLAVDRQTSSIPKGASSSLMTGEPHDSLSSTDDDGDVKWLYPSEQQLYNAMRRKGFQNVPEDSIPVVLQIHNHINERTWDKIQDWNNNDKLRLVRFEGRPEVLTPKAFLLSGVLGVWEKPFDRHDWYVENTTTGTVQRYCIDFYMIPTVGGRNGESLPPTPFVDARPALDHPRAIWLRGRHMLKYAFPGISAALARNQQQHPCQPKTSSGSTFSNVSKPN